VPGLVDALRDGIDVLDVGCGAGRALNLMAWIYPESRFAGYDFLEANIAAARAEAKRSGVKNARFEIRDVTSIGEPGRYDLITAFDAIHDQVRPDLVLAEIARALTDDGVFLMQDIKGSSHVHENVDHPMGTLLYTISCLHCMTVSLSAGGAGLGAMWGREKALEMLAAAGFGNVEVHELPHDFQNFYYVARKR
jgi:2-polyprenyl-3-methyl-5-hydroxy-6-metoxy-1,4-benzoquinol methylase